MVSRDSIVYDDCLRAGD